MTPPHLFQPTEYTAALLLYLRLHAARLPMGSVLEIGSGSGAVMASLLAMGAGTALGVDLEFDAVTLTNALLAEQGFAPRARAVQGDMWTACADQRFDLIVSNLPQFPAAQLSSDSHLPTWSLGGPDGRRLMDAFLQGLPRHLAANGKAIITHNAFISLATTQALLAPHRLQAQAVLHASVPLCSSKVASISPAVLARYQGQSIHTVGPYWFADFDIVEIGWRQNEHEGR